MSVIKRERERKRETEGVNEPLGARDGILENQNEGGKKYFFCWGCHSSLDSSASTILRSRFETQAYYLCFYSQILCYICHCVEKMGEIKPKEAEFGAYLEKVFFVGSDS